MGPVEASAFSEAQGEVIKECMQHPALSAKKVLSAKKPLTNH